MGWEGTGSVLRGGKEERRGKKRMREAGDKKVEKDPKKGPCSKNLPITKGSLRKEKGTGKKKTGGKLTRLSETTGAVAGVFAKNSSGGGREGERRRGLIKCDSLNLSCQRRKKSANRRSAKRNSKKGKTCRLKRKGRRL